MGRYFLPLALIALLCVGCSIAPKGEYSRGQIDRPYALPDDVARTSFGGKSYDLRVTDASDSATGEEESQNESLPILIFEHGISDSASWIYPLGLRWELFQQGPHTVGLSGTTLFFLSAFSLDYWYRLGPKLSLRPYYRGTTLDFFFVREEHRFVGAELLWQTTENWALGFGGHRGSYTSSSEFVEAIVTGITGDETYSSEVTGTFSALTLNTLYSLSEYWDFEASVAVESYSLEGFELIGLGGELGLSLIW